MSAVINKNEFSSELSNCEAKAFFANEVKERLGISVEEFLKCPEKFENNPHYESLMFLAPLLEHASK